MKVEALLFDFDGTLVDTEGPSYRCWQELYEEHGHELPLERWVACVGTIGGFDPVADLEGLLGRSFDRDALVADRDRRHAELVESELLRPGVREYLDGARALGLKVGIVSSASARWIARNLDRLGEGDAWDCILSADHDATIAKPSPHLYEAALRSLAVEPEAAVAFEDSPNGIRAAKAAGIYTVAVPTPVTAGLDLDEADAVLGSFEELPLAELLRRVEDRRAA